jgi:hypothetical protein
MRFINTYRVFESSGDYNELLRDVKECFNDMSDDDQIDDLVQDGSDILLMFTFDTNYQSSTFEDFFSYKQMEFEKLELVKKTLDRLRKVHNGDFDVNLEVSVGANDYNISLRITPGVGKEGEFYKITTDGVKINQGKLISMFKLPKTTEISLTLPNAHLSFKFVNSTELERYKDKLIEEFLELKIEDKPLCTISKFAWSSSSGDEMLKYKIWKDYKRTYGSQMGSGQYTLNSVEFGLNDEFDYTW